MSAEDLDNYETDAELALYREYRDVIKLFTYVVETERRFYLANKVDFAFPPKHVVRCEFPDLGHIVCITQKLRRVSEIPLVYPAGLSFSTRQ